MIYIPKYKIIRPDESLWPTFRTRVGGQFRFTLRGPSGEIKQQRGWSSNTITDTGLSQLVESQQGGATWAAYLLLGDGTTAPTTSDTALSGSLLGYEQNPTSSVQGTPSGPNYERIYDSTYTFGPGEATGTIGELALCSNNVGASGVSVRHLVSPTITKGALDELTVEYRFTVYPDLTDLTGTLDISGTSYDYTCRMLNIGETQYFMPNLGVFNGGIASHYAKASTGALVANTASDLAATQHSADTASAITTGGSPGSYYAEREATWGIDNLGNGSTFVTFAFALGLQTYGVNDLSDRAVAVQFDIDKTVGGGGLLKEDTHALTMGIRVTSDRYP